MLINGLLYHLWESPFGDAMVKQLILPRSLRQETLQELHDTPNSWTFGGFQDTGHIKERFYWVQCQHDVQEWCRKCDVCAQKRGPPKKPKTPLGNIMLNSLWST